ASQTVNPLIHLKDRAMQITAGENVADDYSYPNNEVGVLASEFNTMATRLQTQRDEAVEANAFKTNLLGRVSHELRTPLGAVIGMAGMLSVDEDLRDDHRELANYILQYSDELNVLVEQILEQSRLERAAADSKLVITDINPQEMLTEVQVKLTPAANHKKIEIELIMDDDMPAIIRNDSNKLRQVLNNLVGNAIKFTNEGKVTVHGRALPDDRWAVDVKDTGIGIPDEDLGKIFEAFRQGDEEYTRRYGGVGLGLSITRQFVKAMNGEISVDSSPGEGSYFTITFPTKVEMSEETTGTPR
ncbi:MAG: HAMP domain-containing sensor histidine kinase, partial [Chloroflexota bacterium]